MTPADDPHYSDILHSPEWEAVRTCDDPEDGCPEIVREAQRLEDLAKAESNKPICPRCHSPYVTFSDGVFHCRWNENINWRHWIKSHPHGTLHHGEWFRLPPARSQAIGVEDGS